jgi:hypothetical protein
VPSQQLQGQNNNNKHILTDPIIKINVKGIGCEEVELIQVTVAYLKTLSLHSDGETEKELGRTPGEQTTCPKLHPGISQIVVQA